MAPPQEEPPLQAIIFADFCGGQPSPSRSTAAAQSHPLHNSPLLHYQLYALATTGVAESLVLSSTPQPLPNTVHAMTVTALSNPTWRSHGDALRDVESRQSLRPAHDFLLVQPGALFNLHAGRLARAHAARAAADRNWLVSLVLRRAAAAAPLAVATHAGSGALCLYRRGAAAAAAAVALDTRAENVGLRGGGAVRITTDVVDIGLDVCSPDLLVEFRENFDFDSVRDYVRAKLDGGEAELLGNRMYAHFVDSGAGEFAACVDGFAAVQAANRDVRDGWLWPISPALVARVAGRECVKLENDTVCVGEAAEVDSTAKVVECTLGSGVSVEAGAVVERCVIGDGCRIGAGAVVEGCVLGSAVVVESAARVSEGLLRDGSSVASEVCIPSDCFLDENVCIGCGGGAEAGMKPGTWVSKVAKAAADDAAAEAAGDGSETESESDDSEDESDGVGLVVSPEWLGDGGVGKVQPERRRFHLYLEQTGFSREQVFAGWPGFLESCESDSEDELEGDGADDVGGADDGGGMEDDMCEEDGEKAKMEKFYAEMEETVEHGVSESADVDTIALEVNSLKLGYERMYSHARIGVVRALAAIVRKDSAEALPKAQFAAVKAIFTKWSDLLAKFSSGDNAETQRNLVNELARFLSSDGLILQYVLRTLYDQDVVEEDAILGWAAMERENVAGGSSDEPLKKVLPFIEWLEEADEEEESDD